MPHLWPTVHGGCFLFNAVTLELHNITIISSTFSPHDISFNRKWWYYVYILNNQATDQELWHYTLYDVHTWSSVNSLVDRLPHGVIDVVISPQTLETLLLISKSCHDIIISYCAALMPIITPTPTHTQFNCCGVVNYTDWMRFLSLPPRIPRSCCPDRAADDQAGCQDFVTKASQRAPQHDPCLLELLHLRTRVCPFNR